MKKNIVISLLYAVVIFLIFGTVMSVVRNRGMVHCNTRADLACHDFGTTCAVIEESAGDRYVNRLLLPENIDAFTPDKPKAKYTNYITYRFQIPVREGVNYAISCKKSDYALEIYVDGKQVVKTGKVSESEEDFVPTAAAYEAFFTGRGDCADIIIRQANYNHYKHYPLWFRMGPAEQIANYNRKMLLENVIIAVILLTAALTNLGMFFCFPAKKELLWFFCICFFASVGTVFPKVTAYLAPDINWYVSHKLEICSVIAVFFFSVLYVSVLFQQYVNRTAVKLALTVSGAIFALFAFLPSSIYSRCNEVCLIIVMVTTLPMFVSMLIKLFKLRRTIPQSNRIALLGVVFYALLSVNDAVGYGGYFSNLHLIGTMAGVAVFAIFNTLALSIDFRSSQEMLRQAEVREKELNQTNQTLTRLGRLREVFLSDLSHELKTPLTVIASNAAVAAKQVSMGKTNEMTVSKLGNIEREAVRLGKMVEKMKNSAKEQSNENAENLNIGTILNSVADFCTPLCARNGNSILVRCEEGVWAYSSSNTMFHCLYNLISNATKHCHESEIELNGVRSNGGVVISVTDHGEGMTDEQKKHAFERGFSGDSSTGIGLPLCRELIENEGGTISLSDTPGGGLCVSFILKEAANCGENTDD